MKNRLVFIALLSVVLFLPNQRASAQVSCSTPNITQTGITYACFLQNFDYSATFVNTTGAFSPVSSSNQVPKIPNRLSLTYSWEPQSGLGTYFVIYVRNPGGVVTNQYTFGLGAFCQSPATDNGNGIQSAVLDVSGWPPEFTLEFVQYNSFYGITQTSFDVRLIS